MASMRGIPGLIAAAALVAAFVYTGIAQATALKSRAAVPAPRAAAPVVAVDGAAPGQAGYVHYFLLRLPDETLEIQVGIELPDQRIAWSFPDLGATVSPFIDAGIVEAGGKAYEVWHLYGIRPFPGDAAMTVLQKELAGRIAPLLATRTPYCEDDGPGSACMSCLGFVLRALFPGRHGGYPDLPRDFWRAGTASRYTTRDLLLYLTGMLDLPTRDARLRRLSALTVPADLREDLEALIYSMGATEAAPAAVPQKPAAARPSRLGSRPVRRKGL